MQKRDRRKLSSDLIDKVEQENQRKPRPLIHAMSRMVITLSFAILAGLTISLIAQAFVLSAEAGVKGLAAGALPPIIITYFVLFSRISLTPSEKVLSPFVLYSIAAIWMMALLLSIRYIGSYLNGVPVGVLLASISFSGLVFLARHVPLAAMLACAYGVVSGSLLYMLLFGLSTR